MSQILRPQIARNSNRSNTQNANPRSLLSKTSIQVRQILLPGQSFCSVGAGDRFYVIGATGEVKIRPTADLPGVENSYWAGTGLNLAKSPQEVNTDGDGKLQVAAAQINSFAQLDIRNPDPDRSLYIELHQGFDDYVDNRLTFPASQYSQVARILYDAYHPADYGGAKTFVEMPDLRGTIITDANGDEWFAANRVLVLVLNNDVGDYTILTNFAGDKYVGMAQPLTSAQFPLSGDLGVAMSAGGNIGGVITEVYNCLPLITV